MVKVNLGLFQEKHRTLAAVGGEFGLGFKVIEGIPMPTSAD